MYRLEKTMGWTWYHASEYTKSGRVSASREIRKEMHDNIIGTILDDAFVKGVYYAAVRDDRDNSVWALVCLTATSTTDYYNFGYKEMADSWGPVVHDCPNRILNLLTPTDDESANRWREKCRKNNAQGNSFKSLPDGTRVEWICSSSGYSELQKGRKYTLRKSKQNAWKKRSPWVWHIEGTNWCLKPACVGDDYKLIA